MIYLQLFWEFFQTGLFAIGGGLATIPFLQRIAERTGWYTLEQLADMIAISESTPGPIGINMATYVGFETAGVLGSAIATLAIVLPEIIIVLIVVRFLNKFSASRTVQSVLYGIRPASLGLIAAAGYTVLRLSMLNTDLYAQTQNLLDLFQVGPIALGVAVFFIIKLWKPHPIVVIALSAVVGAVFGFA